MYKTPKRQVSFGSVMWWACVVSAALIFSGRGCNVTDSEAINAMEVNGFTHVKVVRKIWFLPGFAGCSTHDAVAFTVTAINVKGDKVNMLVCSGWPFKGATVRTP